MTFHDLLHDLFKFWKTIGSYSIARLYCTRFSPAHGRVQVQNVRDFPQTKLVSEINSSFLLNRHGDPRIFFQVFAKNSLKKNIFEEEKQFDST